MTVIFAETLPFSIICFEVLLCHIRGKPSPLTFTSHLIFSKVERWLLLRHSQKSLESGVAASDSPQHTAEVTGRFEVPPPPLPPSSPFAAQQTSRALSPDLLLEAHTSKGGEGEAVAKPDAPGLRGERAEIHSARSSFSSLDEEFVRTNVASWIRSRSAKDVQHPDAVVASTRLETQQQLSHVSAGDHLISTPSGPSSEQAQQRPPREREPPQLQLASLTPSSRDPHRETGPQEATAALYSPVPRDPSSATIRRASSITVALLTREHWRSAYASRSLLRHRAPSRRVRLHRVHRAAVDLPIFGTFAEFNMPHAVHGPEQRATVSWQGGTCVISLRSTYSTLATDSSCHQGGSERARRLGRTGQGIPSAKR